jgi:hypothetical protein
MMYDLPDCEGMKFFDDKHVALTATW